MKNLKVKYRTGRSVRVKEITATKTVSSYKYEISVVTESGEYTEQQWEKLLLQQAKELFELDILERLKDYSKTLAWIKTDKEAHKHALELYSHRIWENENWVGYETFNCNITGKIISEQISLI